MRRSMMGKRKKLFIKRFYPAGNYTWIVPRGCTSVDVFLVGGGSGAGQISSGSSYGGGGGGYTKTYRGVGYVRPSSGSWMGTYNDGRDGDAITVFPGQIVAVTVGAGGNGGDGGYSQFMDDRHRAEGGRCVKVNLHGGNGGSGGSGEDESSSVYGGNGGSDGLPGGGVYRGEGQNHTTRDFGEPSGKRNAGGGTGCSHRMKEYHGGESDYEEGSGESFNRRQDSYVGVKGGGGYGGGAGGTFGNNASTRGGDGTVVIRYWAYEE